MEHSRFPWRQCPCPDVRGPSRFACWGIGRLPVGGAAIIYPFFPLDEPAVQPLSNMSVNANELRKGQAIQYNSDVCVVLEVTHRTPGNLRAFVQAILRKIGRAHV